tara:strand:- start:1187 stop:1621 length:435 start_codon:yes stop_codon:yes gene_type:complete
MSKEQQYTFIYNCAILLQVLICSIPALAILLVFQVSFSKAMVFGMAFGMAFVLYRLSDESYREGLNESLDVLIHELLDSVDHYKKVRIIEKRYKRIKRRPYWLILKNRFRLISDEQYKTSMSKVSDDLDEVLQQLSKLEEKRAA